MGTTDTANALRQLASAGRAHHQARAVTLQKGMRLALARVSDDEFDLPMAMIGAVVQTIPGDALREQFDDANLMLQLDGANRTRGAAMLDQALVGGLIQQQTLGKVMEHDGTDRPMTRTDAAMCAPLIDGLLELVVTLLDEAEDCALLDGFRFGVKAEDARTLCMALDALEYTTVRLTIDVAQGVRQGEILLVFPKVEEALQSTAEAGEGGEGVALPELADTVMQVSTSIEMVVCHVPVAMDTVRNLQVGDVLAVPQGTFPSVQMTTLTGRVVGRGTVGQVDGVRAVKPKSRPRHADKPMRRAADAAELDLPDIELPEDADLGPEPLPREEPGPGVVGAALPDLDALDGLAPIGADMRLPDLDGAADAGGLPDLDGLPDLPDLDGLPDLPDLPDVPEVDNAPIGPEDAELPSLDDLPDLTELPELADMPDLPPIKAAS